MMVSRGMAGGILSDTAKTYALAEVVVSATRSVIQLNDSPSKIDLYTSDLLQTMSATSVADVLETTGSVFLQDYGIYGALKTASLRGCSSQEVLVLLNGDRLNSFENGLTDLSLLQLTNVDRIEVLHGGNSALYGPDALGGVVNIITRQPSEIPQVSASVGAGSYGYQHYSLGGDAKLGLLGLSAGYANERGRDNYTFSVDPRYFAGLSPGSTYTRSDADYSLRHGWVNGTAQMNDQTEVSMYVQEDNADRGVPGQFTSPLSVSTAREADDDVEFGAAIRYKGIDNAFFSLRGSGQYSYETYHDPQYGLSLFYKNNHFTFNPQCDFVLSPEQHLSLGLEFAQATLHSSDFLTEITRVQKAVYLSHEMSISFDRSFADRILLYDCLRYDAISDVDRVVTPKLGMNVRLSEKGDIHLRSSVGTSFRSPSFNDLYYPGASNPRLNPERSVSFDVGMTSRCNWFGEQKIELTYFVMRTTDQIVFDPALFIPVNIGKVNSHGLESSFEFSTPNQFLNVGVDYTYTLARNISDPSAASYNHQIIFQPKDNFKVRTSVRVDPAVVTLSYVLIGERFTTATNLTSLPAYRTTNLNLRLKVPDWPVPVSLKCEVNNLFNVDYQIYPLYPMPRRTYRVTVGYN